MSEDDSASSEPRIIPEPPFQQAPTSLVTTMTEVIVNGRKIKVRATAKALVESEGEILYPKSI